MEDLVAALQKIRPAALDALAASGATILGTSHRQKPVKNVGESCPYWTCLTIQSPRRLRSDHWQRRVNCILGYRDFRSHRK
jgi:hypothetical protein